MELNRVRVDPAELATAMELLPLAAGSYDPNGPDYGRRGARNTLIAVVRLLAVLFPNTPTLPLALQDLLQGLADLDRGTVIPLLKPAKVRGRPPNPLGNDLFRALAAAAMTCLMEQQGMSLDLAARDIATRLRRLGYPAGRISHRNIAKWREKMMTERAAENLGVQRYQLALKSTRQMTANEAVTFLLNSLTTLSAGEFPKKGRP